MLVTSPLADLDAAPWNPQAASTIGDEQQLEFFENKVRPLLVAHCLECHSSAKQEGGLRLDSRDAVLNGGDSGKAVDLDVPEESLLISAIEYRDFEMPPSAPLSQDDQAVLREWVALGLPWPENLELKRDPRDRLPTAADREHWAYRPLVRPAPPMLPESQWANDDLDLFVLAAQRNRGLTPAPEADRWSLARRVSFDLTGLPPTPALVEAFINDSQPGAYERFVDQLLESRAFGERWAEAWFDWVRFAESDGYKADDFRPSAWRYRDYVIEAFNRDLPFDRFLTEQLAGDLMASPTPQSLAATGFLRLWIYEYNQRDAQTQWQLILDDVTETTADAFLGMGIGCAKCHDHKYDPLLQEDYFRLQAVFTSFSAIDDLPLLEENGREQWERARNEWREKYRVQLEEKAALEAPYRAAVLAANIEKFPPPIRGMFALAPDERTSWEQQLVELSMRQISTELAKIDFEKKLSGEPLARWQTLRDQIATAEKELPASPSRFAGVSEIPNALTLWPVLGDHERLVTPGLPLVLVPEGVSSDLPLQQPRRLEFAQWLVSDRNPLTARVLANRVWERLMGRGLVESSADFGRLTTPPALPELLDFVAARWRDEGWSFKQLVRSIVTSSTYRQASRRDDEALCVSQDPERLSWWRMESRRLEAGQVRDALLLASGELETRTDGPSANHDALCRSVFLKVLRNSPEPILSVFDFPDRIRSQSCRNLTTTPQQALLLLNHPWVRQRSLQLSQQTEPGVGGREFVSSLQEVFSRVLGRIPTSEERELAERFWLASIERGQSEGLSQEQAHHAAWFDLCHGLLNSNEFLFLD